MINETVDFFGLFFVLIFTILKSGFYLYFILFF